MPFTVTDGDVCVIKHIKARRMWGEIFEYEAFITSIIYKFDTIHISLECTCSPICDKIHPYVK